MTEEQNSAQRGAEDAIREGIRASRRAWVYAHARVPGWACPDDAPPRRLARVEPVPTWGGEPFAEEAAAEDNWLYDDPAYSSIFARDMWADADGYDAWDSAGTTGGEEGF